jgi:hypothetical protein
MQETGLIANAILGFGQMSEPPGCRFRVALTALTMAEYLRDVRKNEVLSHSGLGGSDGAVKCPARRWRPAVPDRA